MRLVHRSTIEGDTDSSANVADSDESETRREVLATNVDLAESILSQTRGLMFRRSVPDDYALVFQFDAVKTRDIHMLFVFFPIDAVWVVDGIVRRVERLQPWRSFAREECDVIVELPAGTATAIEPGDRLVLEAG